MGEGEEVDLFCDTRRSSILFIDILSSNENRLTLRVRNDEY